MSSERAPRRHFETSCVREVQIRTVGSRRLGFWRFRGARNPVWTLTSAEVVERAIENGAGAFGGWSGPVVEFSPRSKSE